MELCWFLKQRPNRGSKQGFVGVVAVVGFWDSRGKRIVDRSGDIPCWVFVGIPFSFHCVDSWGSHNFTGVILNIVVGPGQIVWRTFWRIVVFLMLWVFPK